MDLAVKHPHSCICMDAGLCWKGGALSCGSASQESCSGKHKIHGRALGASCTIGCLLQLAATLGSDLHASPSMCSSTYTAGM